MGKRDFLRLLDFSPAELAACFELAVRVKALTKAGKPHRPLEGKSLAMLFQKPSLRTRVTFEIGMQQLGGIAVYLSTYDFTLDVRETVEDVARNLERWCDAIMVRTFKDDTVDRMARTARVPVINGLTDGHHPCQVVADLLTLYERWDGRLTGRTLAFVGDGNNTATSLLEGAALSGMEYRIASPPGYELPPPVVARAQAAAAATGATITLLEDPVEAVSGADAVYTDTWVSMHQETESARRRHAFLRYQVNNGLLEYAKRDAVVMHCLPAHRGEELTDEVIDGPRSIVFDQAENRLHAQKAILEMLVTGEAGRARRAQAR
jgi:ornithine carbamoyltransferase